MLNRLETKNSVRILSAVCLPFLLSFAPGCVDGTIEDGQKYDWEESFLPDGTPKPVDSSLSGVDGTLRTQTQAITAAGMRVGNSRYDWWDGAIINASTRYGFPDPFFIKAQMYHESEMNNLVMSKVAPCGIPAGWTDGESRAYGLMQITPSCTGYFIGGNGRPNLVKDKTSPYWPTSAYHPGNNLYTGVHIMASILRGLKTQFPGCKATDYVLMAAAAYNAGPRHVTGCGQWSTTGGAYVQKVTGRYRELGLLANVAYPF